MRTLLTGAFATAATVVLLGSGTLHAYGFDRFRRDIQHQDILPGPEGLWAGAITTVELALGLALVVARVDVNWVDEVASLWGATTLFLSFGLFGYVLLRRRPGVPCGCGYSNGVVSAWTVGRAVALAAMCGIAAALSTSALPEPDRVAVSTVVGLAIAILTWMLPPAMARPWAASVAASGPKASTSGEAS